MSSPKTGKHVDPGDAGPRRGLRRSDIIALQQQNSPKDTVLASPFAQKGEASAATAQIKMLKAANDRLQEQYQLQTEKNKKLTNELHQVGSKYKSTMELKDRLKGMIDVREAEIRDMVAQEQDLQEKLRKKDVQLDVLTNKLKNYNMETNQLKETISHLQLKYNALTSQNEFLPQKIGKTQFSVPPSHTVLEEQLRNTMRKNAALREELTMKDLKPKESHSSLTNRPDSNKDGVLHNTLIASLNYQIEELTKKLLDKTNANNVEVELKLKKLENKITESDKELQLTREKLAKKTKEFEQILEDKQLMETEHLKTEAEYLDHVQEISAHKEKLREQLLKSEDERSFFETELRNNKLHEQQKIQEFEETILKLQSTHTSTLDIDRDNCQTIEELKTQIKALIVDKQTIEEQLKKIQQNMGQELLNRDRTIEELRQQKELLENRLKEDDNELQKQIASIDHYKSMITTIGTTNGNDEIKRLQGAYTELQHTNEQLLQHLELAREIANNLEIELSTNTNSVKLEKEDKQTVSQKEEVQILTLRIKDLEQQMELLEHKNMELKNGSVNCFPIAGHDTQNNFQFFFQSEHFPLVLVAQLEAEISDAQENFTQLFMDYSNLKKQYANKLTIVDQMKAQTNENDHTITLLRNVNQNLSSEVTRGKEKIAYLQQLEQQLSSQAEQTIAQLKNRNNEYQDRLQNLEQEYSILQEQLFSVNTTKKRTNQQIFDLQYQYNEILEKTQLDKQVQSMNLIIDTLVNRYNNVTAEKEMVEENMRDLQIQVKSNSQEIEIYQKKYNTMLFQYSEQQMRFKTFVESNSERGDNFEKLLLRRILQLKDNLQQILNIRAHSNSLVSQLTIAQKEIEILRAELLQDISIYIHNCNTLSIELENLREKHQNTIASLTLAELEKAELQQMVQSLNNERTQLLSSTEVISDELTRSKQDNSSFIENISILQGTIERANELLAKNDEDFKKQVQYYEYSIEKLKVEKNDKINIITNLTNENKKLSLIIEREQEKAESLKQAHVQQLNDEIQQNSLFKEQIIMLKYQNTSLIEQSYVLKKDISKSSMENVSLQNNLHDEMLKSEFKEHECNHVKDQLQIKHNELRDIHKQLKTQQAMHIQTCNEKELQILQYSTEIKHLTDQLTKRKKEIEDIKQTFTKFPEVSHTAGYCDKIEFLFCAKQKSEEEISDLRTKLQSSEEREKNSQFTVDKLMNDITSLREEHELGIRQLVTANEQLVEKMKEDNDGRLKSIKLEFEKTEQSLVQKSESYEKVLLEIQEQKTEISTLKSSIFSLEEELRSSNYKFIESNFRFESEKNVAEQKSNQLTHDIEQYNLSIQTQCQTIDEQENKISELAKLLDDLRLTIAEKEKLITTLTNQLSKSDAHVTTENDLGAVMTPMLVEQNTKPKDDVILFQKNGENLEIEIANTSQKKLLIKSIMDNDTSLPKDEELDLSTECTEDYLDELDAELEEELRKEEEEVVEHEQKTEERIMKEEKTKRESRINKILDELLQTEQTYVECLRIIKNYFINEVREQNMEDEKTCNMMFGNTEQIYETNELFLKELAELLKSDNPKQNRVCGVSNMFIRYSNKFKRIYSYYVKNYKASLQTIATVRTRNEIFDAFLKQTALKLKEMNYNNFSLHGLIITPVQRVPRYRLLMEDLGKTCFVPIEVDHVNKAVHWIKQVASYINEHEKLFQKLVSFEQSFEFTNLAIPSRFIVKMALQNDPNSVCRLLRAKSLPCDLLLCNDLLVCVRKDNNTVESVRIVLNGQCNEKPFKIRAKVDNNCKMAFSIFYAQTSNAAEEVLGIQCKSKEDCLDWLRLVNAAIASQIRL